MKKTTLPTQHTVEYIVQCRFRHSPDRWIGNHRFKSYEEAVQQLQQMKADEVSYRTHGKSTTTVSGIGIDTVRYGECDMIGIRIRSRLVTPWETECEETID